MRGHLHDTNTTVDMVTHKLWGHLQITNTTESVVAHKLWGHLRICDVIVHDQFRLMLFANFMVMVAHTQWGHVLNQHAG